MKIEKEKFPCTFCSRVLTSKSILETHMKKHRIKCEKCDNVLFKTFAEKKEHDKILHSKNVNSQKQGKRCKLCPDQTFNSAEDYFIHIQIEHDGKEANYICSDCGKQFRVQGDLTQHIKSKCGTIRRFTCKFCGIKLMTAGSLYNHELRHKGEPRFMCRFCAKLFYTAGQLEVHERIHTKDKAFVCEVCGKGFCHRQSLLTHSTIHTGIKPYVCENCGHSFSCVGNLLKHRKTHADTCGQTPLTTNSVRNPQTKIKVLINTPESSRLKTYSLKLEKKLKLEQLIQKKQQTEEFKSEKVKDTSETENNSEKDEISKAETKTEDPESCVDNLISTIEITNDPLKIETEDEIKMEQDSNKLAVDQVGSTLGDVRITDENKLQTGKRRRNKKEKQEKPPVKRNRVKEVQEFITKRQLENATKANCQYCDKEYTSFACLYKHELIDHENDKERIMYNCKWCTNSYFSRNELKFHKKSCEAKGRKRVFKETASSSFIEKSFTFNAPKIKSTFTCFKCGVEFYKKEALIKHTQRKCGKGPHFACSVCKKVFRSIKNRNTHMVVHTNHKSFACRFCNKKFRWKNAKKVHEATHTGKKPYACLFCSKTFAQKSVLLTHFTCHTGLKPYCCESCGSRFTYFSNFIKHRITHYKECKKWVKPIQIKTE